MGINNNLGKAMAYIAMVGGAIAAGCGMIALYCIPEPSVPPFELSMSLGFMGAVLFIIGYLGIMRAELREIKEAIKHG